MKKSALDIYGQYLEKRSIFPAFIKTCPEQNLKTTVIIPCFNEPDILATLCSLAKCQTPNKSTEALIVINSSETTEDEIVLQNRKTQAEIKGWAKDNETNWLKFHTILLEKIRKKDAGAGYARKVGMDEAIRRFSIAKVENGIICSLDADTTVAPNYLVEIEKLFRKKTSCNGCSVYFEHPLEGNEFDQKVYQRVAEYELHIRYYKQALKYIGFPYFHYTIGSSFVVSAPAYCAQGGMNKKQAGEDFYFLQKIMPMSNYFELNTTTVYPSARPSDRVPFGTGPIIKQYLDQPEQAFLTYNFEAFEPLKQLFEDISLLFKADNNKLQKILESYHPAMKSFLQENEFENSIQIINKNTTSLKSFEKRFFHWFDGFKIIKYLNYAHESHFEKQAIEKEFKKLNHTQITDLQKYNTTKLLQLARNFEKTNVKV